MKIKVKVKKLGGKRGGNWSATIEAVVLQRTVTNEPVYGGAEVLSTWPSALNPRQMQELNEQVKATTDALLLDPDPAVLVFKTEN
jgi:hypothetical protein